MTKTKKAPAGAATPTEAKRRDLSYSTSQSNITTISIAGQPSAYLSRGVDNALPARELAKLMGYSDTRPLRLAIERERREGVLILSGDAGYFLPSVDEEQAAQEVAAFVRRTDARMASNRLSVRACKSYLRRRKRHEVVGQTDLFADEGAE